MIIRVDKCVTCDIKKFSSRSLQYEPKLFINNEIVPTVKAGDSFKYLGSYFNFEMDNEVHKEKLNPSPLDMVTRFDALPVLPKYKSLLYQQYILSKLSWHLTVATLPKTWVIQHLDTVVARFVRQWLDLPISATLSGTFPKINLVSISSFLLLNSSNVKPSCEILCNLHSMMPLRHFEKVLVRA